jgi:hypothetical protein
VFFLVAIHGAGVSPLLLPPCARILRATAGVSLKAHSTGHYELLAESCAFTVHARPAPKKLAVTRRISISHQRFALRIEFHSFFLNDAGNFEC